MKPAPPVTSRPHGGRRLGSGMFVTFEGVDWSGKSTQAELLADWLREQGRTVLATREPGGTPVGEAVREVVLHGHDMTPWAEAALYAAARADHVAAGDPAGARARRGRRLRPLPRLVGRLPGRRARARRGTRARAEPDRHRRAAARPHLPRAARPGRGAQPRAASEPRPHRARGRRLHAPRRRGLPRARRARARRGSSRSTARARPSEIAEEVREHVRELL